MMTLFQIPQNAPYSPQQRVWLNGFLMGMRSQLQQATENQSSQAQRLIHVLYGSQTGNAESVAREVATAAKARGLTPIVKSMDEVELSALTTIDYLLIVTSTYGEGEMPDNAELLWQAVSSESAPRLTHCRYSVLALGDTGYDLFCQAGIDWDQRLSELGANRISPLVLCDVDFEANAEQWIDTVIPLMAEGMQSVTQIETQVVEQKPQYHRKNPFPATLLDNRRLTSEASSKEIRHYEFSLAGSNLRYEAGDVLNVLPINCPALVADLLAAMGCNGDEEVSVNGQLMQLSAALSSEFEIKLPSKELVTWLALCSGDAELNQLLIGDKSALADFLWGRDTLDLLKQYPVVNVSATDWISVLKPLQPRAYSISSSSRLYPESVHLTVASVRYQSQNRLHKGVCSTYLADIATLGEPVKVFLTANKTFKVPENNELPMIMVGPGTGVAPFRAFLQERQARNAQGKNWLFFGDRNAAADFIYQEELLAMQASGLLTRLDLAFSRDQAEKIYVQDRMREAGAELFAWLQQGGYFFVCGDASQMAKDVDRALHEIIAKYGQMSILQAADYVNQLKKDKRYVRDVY